MKILLLLLVIISTSFIKISSKENFDKTNMRGIENNSTVSSIKFLENSEESQNPDNLNLLLNSNYPIAVFHGIGDTCEGEMGYWTDYLGQKLGTYAKCVEYGRKELSIFQRIKKLSEIACDLINSDEKFNDGFNIVGFSQGGLIGRYIVEKCKTKGDVKRFISVGGPHMGISKIPCDSVPQIKFLCGVGDYLGQYAVFIPGVDRIYAPLGYTRTPETEELYRKYNEYLAPLNNENYDKDENNKLKLTKLEKLVLIKFMKDEVLTPRESAWFQKYDENYNVEDLKKSDFYKLDYLGIRELNESNRIEFHEFKGIHMQLTQEEIDLYVVPALFR